MARAFEQQAARELAVLRKQVRKLALRQPSVVAAAVLPAVKVGRTLSVQSIPDRTWTTVSWDTEVFDPADLWDSGEASRLVANADGKWLVVANVGWEADAVGFRTLAVARVSVTYGSNSIFSVQDDAPTTGNNWWANTAGLVALAAGDHVYALVYQTSGSLLDLRTDGNWLQMVKVA